MCLVNFLKIMRFPLTLQRMLLLLVSPIYIHGKVEMGKKDRSKGNISGKAPSRSNDDTVSIRQANSFTIGQVNDIIDPNVKGWDVRADHQRLKWLLTSLLLGGIGGFLFGFAFWSPVPIYFRHRLRTAIFASTVYKLLSLDANLLEDIHFTHRILHIGKLSKWTRGIAANNPEDPDGAHLFAVLREAVVREKGGYVHPDLGLMHPAPSGSARGLGIVKNSYQKCQSRCFPGSEQEKNEADSDDYTNSYRQVEILVQVPLAYQMTRQTALDILQKLIPDDVQQKRPLQRLNDAVLLALQLAHERGVGRYSRWMPYIASLPHIPTCGYNRKLRFQMMDTMQVLTEEMGVDTEGWPDELVKAMLYGESIAESLNNDYGLFMKHPNTTVSSSDLNEADRGLDNIQWALCQVASRATGGSNKLGSLRLIPIIDLINHDMSAGGFIELKGNERLEDNDFIDATFDDAGTFVVRSLRHGRRKPLRQGQELLVNYNVPQYSALDWFVSMGFVPPERWRPWIKIDPVLPQVRRDWPFRDDSLQPFEEMWRLKEERIRRQLENADL